MIYLLNYQPKSHNIVRGARCLGVSTITTNNVVYHLWTWTNRAPHKSSRNIKENSDSPFQFFFFCKEDFLFVTLCWYTKAYIYNNGCDKRTKWMNWLAVRIISNMVPYTRNTNAKVKVIKMKVNEVGGVYHQKVLVVE